MKPWEMRPPEVAYLLNPAFCGEILRRCIIAYREKSSRNMPYSLLFIILPLILPTESRSNIPNTSASNFQNWLNLHKEVLIGFADRASGLVPITKEAIIFLMQIGILKLDGQGTAQILRRKISKTRSNRLDGEQCFRKAEILGKMLARAENETTIFSLVGVKP